MSICSMTGFARADGLTGRCAWAWEARSVNARGLEVRCRLPSGLEALEPAVRRQVAAVLKRGNVSINLQLVWTAGAQAVRVDMDVLAQLLGLAEQVRARLPDAVPPSVDGLLGLRGVVEIVDPMPTGDARAALEAALLEGLEQLLAALAGTRRGEGERLACVLGEHLDKLAGLCRSARECAAAQPGVIRDRFIQQIQALLSEATPLSPERLTQEAAMLALKADPREELDRLLAHHQAADGLVGKGGAVGRQLDFLCQELNREANTLCAKSADLELTRIGLDLKQCVEQIREQVQNIE